MSFRQSFYQNIEEQEGDIIFQGLYQKLHSFIFSINL